MGRLLAVALGALVVSASAAAARSPTDPTYRPRAADLRVARKLVLTRADVPRTFADGGIENSSGGNDFGCKSPDLHRLVETADVDGHTFRRQGGTTGFTVIVSEASVFRSAGEAQRSFDWVNGYGSATITRCFTAAFRAGLSKDAKMAALHVTPLHRTSGDIELIGWEIRTKIEAYGVWLPVEMRLTGYRRGRALTVLMMTNAGPGLEAGLVGALSDAVTAKLARTPVGG
jgi:hypothetical protein